jgi:hypothetical protein
MYVSAEPKGSHQRGKPLPVETIQRLKRLYQRAQKLKEACRGAGVSRPTARKYLGITKPPDLDI